MFPLTVSTYLFLLHMMHNQIHSKFIQVIICIRIHSLFCVLNVMFPSRRMRLPKLPPPQKWYSGPTLSAPPLSSHKYHTSGRKSGFLYGFHCPAFSRTKKKRQSQCIKKRSSQQQTESLRILNVLFLLQCQWIWKQRTTNKIHSFVRPAASLSPTKPVL